MSPEHKAYVVRESKGLLRAEPLDLELPKPDKGHYLRVTQRDGVTFFVETQKDQEAMEQLRVHLKTVGHESVDDALFFDQKYNVDILDLHRKRLKPQNIDLR